MNTKKLFFTYAMLLLASVLLVISTSCEKEDDTEPPVENGNNGDNDDNGGSNDFSGSSGTFVDDRDGTEYKWVRIGGEGEKSGYEAIWMAENLRYLPSVKGPGPGSNTEHYYYVYDYDGTSVSDAKATGNYTIYGVLYNWSAAMAGDSSTTESPSRVQGICPAGWFLPSDEDFTRLENFLSDNGYNYDGTTGGGRLKIGKALASLNGWESSTVSGAVGNTDFPEYRNMSGFSLRPGGHRAPHINNGQFLREGRVGYLWTSTESSSNFARSRSLSYNSISISRFTHEYSHGHSVRCVKH